MSKMNTLMYYEMSFTSLSREILQKVLVGIYNIKKESHSHISM
jgi:hypothetical protein